MSGSLKGNTSQPSSNRPTVVAVCRYLEEWRRKDGSNLFTECQFSDNHADFLVISALLFFLHLSPEGKMEMLQFPVCMDLFSSRGRFPGFADFGGSSIPRMHKAELMLFFSCNRENNMIWNMAWSRTMKKKKA